MHQLAIMANLLKLFSPENFIRIFWGFLLFVTATIGYTVY